MEKRKIVVIDSATNRKVEVMTDATTLGELKRDLRPSGISFENKDWLEGFSQTSPVSDESQLPQAVTYQGKTTNNLVYMLTNTNKTIKNGMDRKEAYSVIAKNENLKEIIKNKFGKNYTQVKTADLEKIIAKEINEKMNKEIKKGYNKVKETVDSKKEALEEPKEEDQCAKCKEVTAEDIKDILNEIHHGLLIVQHWLEENISTQPVEVTLTDEDFEEIFK